MVVVVVSFQRWVFVVSYCLTKVVLKLALFRRSILVLVAVCVGLVTLRRV